MSRMGGPVYLDCAATAPLDPRVQDVVSRYLGTEFGNAGSRTHERGRAARGAVERARAQIARAVDARRNEVILTSGATESNNLAILGLEAEGHRSGRRHLISTRIEHHAVLEPLQVMQARGFEVTLLDPVPGGWVEADAVRAAVRPDTLLVSVMQVNNETGVRQPIRAIAEALVGTETLFHVDAAQGLGLEFETLRHQRIDLISLSAHKICGPQGVGALITRRRAGTRPPLTPLLYGGGQELGLRSGTVPVPLVAGFGRAAELAVEEHEARWAAAVELQRALVEGLTALCPRFHGDLDRVAPHILNFSIPGLDSESVIEAWRDLAAVSDGAACTSQSYRCSHVLAAMGLDPDEDAGAIRVSWCHLTERPDIRALVDAVGRARSGAERATHPGGMTAAPAGSD